MKINKDDFNKLSQLDRIEFRQRLKEIDDKYPNSISGIVHSIYLIVFYFISIIICKTYITVIGSSAIIEPSMWILIILPLAYVGDIITIIVRDRKIKELAQEYFKVEAKKK